MRQTLVRLHAWLYLALVLAVCLLGAWAVSTAAPVPSTDEFNVIRWELRHAPNKWLYLTGRFLRGGLSPAEENERLGRYLLLTARIRQLGQGDPDDSTAGEQLTQLTNERAGLENDVEAVIEGRLTSLLGDLGLESSLPLFPAARWVFPPVDVEFGEPPRVLAVSPRDRIELVEQRPLRPDFSRNEAVELERTLEAGGARSALVTTISGVATYPSLVRPVGEYERLVETVAHEWVHHYLAFKPLGLRYLSNLELQTLNETVADVAAEDLAALLVERHPLPGEVARELDALAPAEPEAEVDRVLRQLRLGVEALLAKGRIEEAEALMEQRRRELEEQGVFFRRINQAFFASRSIYGTDPASLSPLGEQVLELRARTGSVGPFLRTASGLTSGANLERLLEGLDQGRR